MTVTDSAPPLGADSGRPNCPLVPDAPDGSNREHVDLYFFFFGFFDPEVLVGGALLACKACSNITRSCLWTIVPSEAYVQSGGRTSTGDIGTEDTGTGTGDTETEDIRTGTGDTGTEETEDIRTGTGDTGTEDTGTEDTGAEDTGTEDTGTEDTGTEDTGTEDTGTGDTGTVGTDSEA